MVAKVCQVFPSFLFFYLELTGIFFFSFSDGQIYIWHRDTGNLIKVLSGHGPGSVNAVSWNKGYSGGSMFGSVSDDRTVRIWEIPPLTKN